MNEPLSRVQGDGWSGVRMKPNLWPEGVPPFVDETGRAIVAKCGALTVGPCGGMPIGMHTQAPFATHADAIESLARDFP